MISRAGFEYIRNLVAQRAGIRFDPGLEYLVESRLLPLARLYKAGSVNEFIRMMQSGTIRDPEQNLIEALADKETSFFRDVRPFDALRRNIFPDLINKRANKRKLSIWCLGCSTGQEPYSVALLLREYFPDLQTWELEILASDVSAEALHTARAGLYNQVEVNRGLPATLLVKHFQKDGLGWRLKEEVRRMVQFSQMNLFEAWPAPRKFDVILLRNVIGRFVAESQVEILRKARRRLESDGSLFLGTKETPQGMNEIFEEIKFDKGVCYRPMPGGEEDVEESDEDRQRKLRELGNWAQLAHLAIARVGIDREKVGQLLAADEELKGRLLDSIQREMGEKKLSPKVAEEAMAQARREHLLTTAIATPICKALNESFQSMLSVGVEPADLTVFDADAQELVSGSTKLSGIVAGRLSVRFRPELARDLTVEALGLSPDDVAAEVVNDFIGQVVSLVSNLMNSSLSTALLKCKFESVEVTRGKRAQVTMTPKAVFLPLVFQYQSRHPIWVDIFVSAIE